MDAWQLQDAKNRFSEMFEKALVSGPQKVTRRGKDAVIVISERDFLQSQAKAARPHLVDALLDSPLRGVDFELDLGRSSEPARDVEL